MASDQAIATDRLRRSLLAFRTAKSFFLNAHRRPQTRPQAEVIAYWTGLGRQVKADLRLAAAEVEAAFQKFAAAGLVVGGTDRLLVAEARRYFAEGKPMTAQEQAAANDQLRRALLAFQAAQNQLLQAYRRLKNLPAEEVEAFWTASGERIERNVQTTAAEVVAAFRVFSAAGLIASAEDRHRVNEAQRHLAESKA